MRGLILAAGEGKRARKATGSYLKCLFPISSPTETLLGMLISQLHKANIRDLVIVGGYRYGELQTSIHRFITQKKLNNKHVLLDARPECSQGPIFSFLKAEFEFSSIDNFLLLPADTLFHPHFFPWLVSIDFARFDANSIHVFYTDHLTKISMTTRIFEVTSSLSKEIVSDILPYKKWKKLPASFSSSPKVMIPIILLTGSFFLVDRRGVEKGFTRVIQILIDLLRNEQEWEIVAHHFKAESWVFQDFDVPDDILKLQSILSSRY